MSDGGQGDGKVLSGKKRKALAKTLLKDTHPEIYQQAVAAGNPGINLEKLTTGTATQVKFKCEKHTACDGHVWTTSVILRTRSGTKCPCCAGLRYCKCSANYGGLKKARPDIFAEIDLELNKNVPNLDELSLHSRTKLWFRCSKAKCGHHIWQTPVRTRVHAGCPFCTTGTHRRYCDCMIGQTLASRPDVIAFIYPQDQLKTVDVTQLNLKSGKTFSWKCEVHKTCDLHVWTATVHERLRFYPKGCPYCARGGTKCCPCDAAKMLQSRTDLVAELDMPKNNAERLDVNVKLHSEAKLWWKCKDGHSWKTTASIRSRGHGCPECALNRTQSKLVEAARAVLDDMKIEHMPEKRFDDCRRINPLPFDLYLPGIGKNGALIELDGPQHFTQSGFWCGNLSPEERLKLIQLHDSIKNEYAKTRYPFLRLAHTIDLQSEVRTEITKFIADIKSSADGTPPLQRFVGRPYQKKG